MALWSFKPKCCFCGEKKGFLHSVHGYGIYGEMGARVYYHPECRNAVEVSPEEYGHINVDKALHIDELEEYCIRNTNSSIVQDFKEKIEKCHTNHFSRMIPKIR
jgi:hypothetical protein